MEALIIACVPIIASCVANFTEVKPADKPATKMIKRVINIFALNWSAKAGK